MTSHRKGREQVARSSARERVRRLRVALKNARAQRRAVRARARETCRTARAQVTAWAKRERELLRLEREQLRKRSKALPGEVRRRRTQTRAECARARELAKSEGDGAVLLASSELATELDAQAREKRWKRKPSNAPVGRALAKERRQESDSDVRANLSPDELIVWATVRDRIKPTGRMSRTESFHHWVHEHRGEVARILDKHVEREIAELERQERAAAREHARSYRRVSDADLAAHVRSSVGSLSDVPF